MITTKYFKPLSSCSLAHKNKITVQQPWKDISPLSSSENHSWLWLKLLHLKSPLWLWGGHLPRWLSASDGIHLCNMQRSTVQRTSAGGAPASLAEMVLKGNCGLRPQFISLLPSLPSCRQKGWTYITIWALSSLSLPMFPHQHSPNKSNLALMPVTQTAVAYICTVHKIKWGRSTFHKQSHFKATG